MFRQQQHQKRLGKPGAKKSGVVKTHRDFVRGGNDVSAFIKNYKQIEHEKIQGRKAMGQARTEVLNSGDL